MGKGFSTEAVDKKNRIDHFLQQHVIKDAPEVIAQVDNLEKAWRKFKDATSELECALARCEGALRKGFPDWDEYQMLCDGLEERKDMIGAVMGDMSR